MLRLRPLPTEARNPFNVARQYHLLASSGYQPRYIQVVISPLPWFSISDSSALQAEGMTVVIVGFISSYGIQMLKLSASAIPYDHQLQNGYGICLPSNNNYSTRL